MSNDARLNPIKQRNTQQQLLHVFRLVCENFFGEVIEDVAFGLAQDFDEVWRLALARAFTESLALRDLADELQRGNPPVRALAILGQLRGRQFQVKDFAEKFLRFFIRKKQLVAVNDGRARPAIGAWPARAAANPLR